MCKYCGMQLHVGGKEKHRQQQQANCVLASMCCVFVKRLACIAETLLHVSSARPAAGGACASGQALDNGGAISRGGGACA